MTLYGVHLGAETVPLVQLTAMWRRIEYLGFEWISVWDHFVPGLTAQEGAWDAVAAHTALALSTHRATVGCLVYSVTHRHPAVLANAVATIDNFSGGRAALGIGAGWSTEEHRAYGIPFPSAGERLDLLAEAVPCMRRLFDGETVTFEGAHLRLADARVVPGPVQPRLPIWVGGGGEKRTLRIAAEHADGWNSPAGLLPDEFARKVRILGGHCAAVGRDPATIRKAANVMLAWNRDALNTMSWIRDARTGSARVDFDEFLTAYESASLIGSDDEVLARINAYVEAGADQVNFSYLPQWGVEGLERVAALLALPSPRD